MATKKHLSEEIFRVLRNAGLIASDGNCICNIIPSRQLAAHCITDDGVHFFVKRLNSHRSVGDAWIEKVIETAQNRCSHHQPKIHINDDGWLITDFCANTETLQNAPHKMLTGALARAMGTALASFHAASRLVLENTPESELSTLQNKIKAMPPMSLSDYTKTPGLDRDIYIRYSQQCAAGVLTLSRHLSAVCAVHGDLQGGNILLGLSEGDTFHIVDWERAGIGDPCWDLGHLLAALMQKWARTITDLTAPLDQILSPTQGTWHTQASWYTQLLGAYAAEAPGIILSEIRSVKICRIAGHAILERSRNILHVRGVFTGHDVLMLSIAETLINRPEQTVPSLLPGLQLGGTGV